MDKDKELPKTKDALLELRLEVQGEMDSITTQITEARRRFAAGEGGADRDWLRRAESALKHKGRMMQAIQLELSRLKGKSSDRIESAFIEAARELLLPEVFKNVMDAAHERMEETR